MSLSFFLIIFTEINIDIMCGRSSLTKTEKELEARFKATFYSDDLERYNPLPNYNVAPTNMHPVIINKDISHINVYKWGLIPSWAKDGKVGYNMINARVESLLEKPAFKQLVDKKRCIIPMDGFYEWKKTGKEKQPYRIFTRDNEIFGVAGLYDEWKNPSGITIHSYTIITLEANEFMRPIHDRMPAILGNEAEQLWLDDTLPTKDLLALLIKYESDKMDCYPVSPKVGNVKEKGKDLIEPIQLTVQTSLF
jgi:putative SOS response-associated peptidase YedK